ncbi:MAG TPA: transglutaminaseTgpA domain-containing protein [Thermoanaerobaculia bacterium]|nr:transglutaminaseTgpA domain-containing protein [Thermoanaerobaculia bacterium]
MNRVALELESILLAVVAPLPLYLTYTVGVGPLIAYHLCLLGLALSISRSGRRVGLPPAAAKVLAVGYFVFFFIDGLFLSQRLIKSSAHLLLFLAVYLMVEAEWAANHRKRLLVTFLIFVAATATSTHMSIVVFILLFGFLAVRQLMHASHAESLAPTPHSMDATAPASRPAAFYVVVSASVAMLLFPLLPRLRDPAVRGFVGPLHSSVTGLSETIDFRSAREITPSSDVIARVWMGQEAVPFFTPLRLRGAIYDRYDEGVWKARASMIRALQVRERNGVFTIGRRQGFRREAKVQQKTVPSHKLFIPVGTYAIAGPNYILEGPAPGIYRVGRSQGGSTEYEVAMSRDVLPVRPEAPRPVEYPISAEVSAFARSIVGSSVSPREASAKIESHLASRFRYIPDPSVLGAPMTLEDFLLREKRGHCEYFAAGMVVLLSSLDIPARVAGGFYGGELNPLTGYFVVRSRDAHAWVEVFDGAKWLTFDPTPASLRPGSASSGLLAAYLTAINDSVTYLWDRYVLTYGFFDQLAFLSQAAERLRQAMASLDASLAREARRMEPRALIPLALVVVLVAAAARFRRMRRTTLFGELVAALERAGIEVQSSMTPFELTTSVSRMRPDLARHVEIVVGHYVVERFSSRPPSPESRAAARAALEVLRKAGNGGAATPAS